MTKKLLTWLASCGVILSALRQAEHTLADDIALDPLVPPAIVYWRAPSTRWNQREASATASVGASTIA